MTGPELIICDEPVSALDVSIQAQILNLLEDLKAEYGLTLVFIAHDLAVVKNISDRVAVMYLGKMCEISEADELYAHPAHPYTELLLGSSPVPDPSIDVDRHPGDRRGAAITVRRRRRGAGSARGARSPTRCARRKNRSCGVSATITSWPVTTRSSSHGTTPRPPRSRSRSGPRKQAKTAGDAPTV